MGCRGGSAREFIWWQPTDIRARGVQQSLSPRPALQWTQVSPWLPHWKVSCHMWCPQKAQGHQVWCS